MNKRQRFAPVCTLALGTFLLILAQGCGSKSTQQTDAAETATTESQEIYEFPHLKVSDTVTVCGRVFGYTLLREPAEGQAPVHNVMSGDTRDNTIALTVSSGGGQIFHHTFTKESFKAETPEDIYPTAVLQEAGAMPEQTGTLPRFWFSLGEPNADLITFVVTLSPDGTFTYQPDFIDYVPQEGE